MPRLIREIRAALTGERPAPVNGVPARTGGAPSSAGPDIHLEVETEGDGGRRYRRQRSPGDPAVPVAESVTDHYLVCLEDGERLHMLKRHLRSAYGLTPEAYREKWKLPPDYPMTAPAYSEVRRRIARKENDRRAAGGSAG